MAVDAKIREHDLGADEFSSLSFTSYTSVHREVPGCFTSPHGPSAILRRPLLSRFV